MKILVLRFSALGDVALTVPAVQQILANNPTCEIVFVSRPFLAPLFFNIERLTFVGIDTKRYHGIVGLAKLSAFLLKEFDFEKVVDLHKSLRTRIIGVFLRFNGIHYFSIDKGKLEKLKLIRRNLQPVFPLKHHLVRYLEVFEKAGFQIGNQEQAFLIKINPNSEIIAKNFLKGNEVKTLIGIAPFAAHKLKEWPFAKLKGLIELLIQDENKIIILFGGKADKEKITPLLKMSNQIISAIEIEGGLSTELALIKHLKLMVSMDSGNMHLAAGVGTKVLSIFGPTHPYLGFAPYLQNDQIIQNIELNCRPCSVFGNKPCFRGDRACMERISENEVFERIQKEDFVSNKLC